MLFNSNSGWSPVDFQAPCALPVDRFSRPLPVDYRLRASMKKSPDLDP
jgi:hypothetical protein